MKHYQEKPNVVHNTLTGNGDYVIQISIKSGSILHSTESRLSNVKSYQIQSNDLVIHIHSTQLTDIVYVYNL